MIKAACIQLNSGSDIQKNLDTASGLIREAAAQGATLIQTPEITDYVISNRAEKMDQAFDEEDHPGIPFFSLLAAELGVTLIIGSMCIKVADDRIANRCYVFNPDGEITARYDKIHLYDANLPTGECHQESKVFIAGDQLRMVEGEGAKIGLSICYDLRFAYMFRDMAKAGAQVMSIPAAFTVSSGQAHWEVLLRARAIETGSFVLAAAQSGDHDGVRDTYGHTMIIDPWGRVIVGMTTGEGYVTADLDLTDVDKARGAIAALKHDREYTK